MAMRFVPEPGAFAKLSHTDEMRARLTELGEEGLEQARAAAPVDSGGYLSGLYTKLADYPSQLVTQVWAVDRISIQVEYGTGFQLLAVNGRDARGRFTGAVHGRPQGGDSPAYHPLLRALLALEGRQ